MDRARTARQQREMRATLRIAILFAGCRHTQTTGTTSAMVPTVDEMAKTAKLQELELHIPPRAPSPSGRALALVVLHGFGSNEQDLVGLARTFDPRLDYTVSRRRSRSAAAPLPGST